MSGSDDAEGLRGLLERTARWLDAVPPLRLLLLLAAAAVLANGLWVIPNFDRSLAISQHLDVGVRHYLMYSLLGPVLGAATGLNRNIPVFAGLHLALLLGGLAALTRLVERRHGAPAARAVLLTFFATSLPNVLFTWIGYDILSFVLTCGIVLALRRPWVLAVLGVLLGVNHFYQGVFVLGALAVWTWADPARRGWRDVPRVAVPLALGLCAGWALVLAHLHRHGLSDIPGRVDYNREVTFARFVISALNNPQLTAFSTFSVGWLLVAVLLRAARGSRVAVGFGLVLAVDALAMLRLTDHTRILNLLLWPFLLAWVLHDQSAPERQAARRPVFAALLWLTLLVPKVIVWEGGVHGSVLLYSVDALLHATVPGYPALLNYGAENYLYFPFH